MPRALRLPAITVFLLLVLWGLLWLGLLYIGGHLRNLYARVEVSPGQIAWLQVRGSRVRTAPTAEALASADWIEPRASDWGYLEFPAVDLPLSATEEAGRWQSGKLFIGLYPSDCEAEWRLKARHADGALWEFRVSDALLCGGSPDSAPLNEFPDPGDLALDVAADSVREAGQLAIEVVLAPGCGPTAGLEVLRSNREVGAEVRILDSKGDVVASHRGPLDDFGYT